ncbi:putative S-adenosylmethionine-dependent methyltransferase [compost metagenome]
MDFTGERFVPGETGQELEIEHIQRYRMLKELVSGKKVLDAACGEGYGSYILSLSASQVMGIDIDEEAIRCASDKYQRTNVSFITSGINKLPFNDSSFDVVVSFETLEHVSYEVQIHFMNEIKRVLTPDGVLIISTPNKLVYSDIPGYRNPFHVKELYREEFNAMLTDYYKNVSIMSQRFEVSSIIGGNQIDTYRATNVSSSIEDKYMIAFCSDILYETIPVSSVHIFSGKYNQLISRILHLQKEVEERNRHIVNLDVEISSLREIFNEYQSLRRDIRQLIKNSQSESKEVEIEAETALLGRIIEDLNKKIEEMREVNKELLSQLQQAETGLIKEMQNHSFELAQLNTQLLKLDKDNAHQKETIAEQKKHIEQQKNHNEQQKNYVEERNSYIEELKKNIEQLTEKVGTVEKDYEDLFVQLSNKNGHIEELLQQERELNNIYASGGWKLLLKYYRLRDKLAPLNSKRRLISKLLLLTLKHPGLMLSKLKKENIKKLNYYLQTEEAKRIEGRIETFVDRHHEVNDERRFTAQIVEEGEELERIKFETYENPLVSIIIPVYNQWMYTYSCLASIYKNTEGIPYEIILADDMSTDETININNYIENIVVVRDGENRGFLLNCNNASSYCKGKYIFFLNNDTNVTPGWLSALIEVAENDKNIGIVGSKLVYPDGRLQEAGGIIWNDASGWNYGRLDDPEKPEYNYLKEADYISGAAILVRKEDWDTLGGFDTRYVPAYFEDSDLAFGIRSLGHKVVLQPKSVIIHFEGISHGTDTNSGIKSYQIQNKEKFMEKWSKVLKEDHFLNSEHVFWARDRSKNKKTIVVVDHYVPHYDKDAGSRCTYLYLNLFVSMGFHVVFIGDNFYKHEPYTTQLQQLGIEVLYGNHYAKNIMKWIKTNGKYIDYVYLNRPHISIKYIHEFRKNTEAKIIYFGHDLHFVRELRNYELTQNPSLLKSADEWKRIEYELFNASDVVHVVGTYEQGVLKKDFPNKPIRNIPLYPYQQLYKEKKLIPSFAERQGLLFVGGFNHAPNYDGVVWFIDEIFGGIQAEISDIKLYIVGSNPPADLIERQNSSIIVTGFVTDEELERYYDSSRLVVIPLRYGAGVKGKVVEAAYHQVPMVTTSIGAEGLPDAQSVMIIHDESTKFSKAVVELYQDEQKWRAISDSSEKYIEDHFTTRAAKRIIELDFNN